MRIFIIYYRRLDVCFHDLKPYIRRMLFPESSNVDIKMQMGN